MSRVRLVLLGTPQTIAGTVYGTIVVMAAIAASAGRTPDIWSVVVAVVATVVVLWIAHVYSHALGETLELGRRLDAAELASVARRELAIPLSAVAPLAALVLGGLGVLADSTAGWVAMALGVAALGVQGVRYAGVGRMTRLGALATVAINVSLGLAIVALKAGISH